MQKHQVDSQAVYVAYITLTYKKSCLKFTLKQLSTYLAIISSDFQNLKPVQILRPHIKA